jgi:hypothetical protein
MRSGVAGFETDFSYLRFNNSDGESEYCWLVTGFITLD